MKNWVLFLATVFVATAADAQQISLYPTGPAEDASFVRFIDATGKDVGVSSAGGKVVLSTRQPATAFMSVPAKWNVRGHITLGDQQVPVDLQVKPGEFANVIALLGTGGLQTQVLREQPDDFNALKASIGFVNLAGAHCPGAGLKVAGHDVWLFQNSAPASMQRRSINPVQLSVQLVCAGQPVGGAGGAVSLGQLDAGARYSVLAMPEGGSAKLLFVADRMER